MCGRYEKMFYVGKRVGFYGGLVVCGLFFFYGLYFGYFYWGFVCGGFCIDCGEE